MPIFGGVVTGRGKSARTLPKGVYVVDGEPAGRVQELFVDSARFTGIEPPKNFRMSKGEIFYEGGRIVEVILKGTLPPTRGEEWFDFPVMEDEEWDIFPQTQDEEWDGYPRSVYEKSEWTVLTWSTGDSDFSLVNDLSVSFSQRDLGRPYVAALSIGGPVLLRWDMASEPTATPPADADVRLIRIPEPVKRSAEGEDRAGFEAAILYAEWLAKSAREMKTLLKLLREGGELDFIDQYRAFGHAFEPLLRQWINDGDSGGSSRLSFSLKELGEAEMRGRLTKAVAAIARDHLIIRAGRKPGSKTKPENPGSEIRAREQKEYDDERRRVILDLIEVMYKSLRRTMPAAEAEAELKVKGVIATSKISKSTFYDWLRRIGCGFEDLKTEALRRAGN